FSILILLTIIILSVYGYEWVEQKGEVYKGVEVYSHSVPGSFDEQGNYVIKYLIIPPENENSSGPFVKYSMIALKIWNQSIRAYGESACPTLKKLILKGYVKGVNDTEGYYVKIKVMPLQVRYYAVGMYSCSPSECLATIDTWEYNKYLRYGLGNSIILILAHEIGHSFKLGHEARFNSERLLDYRGLRVSRGSPVPDYYYPPFPDSHILEALCHIFTPIINNRIDKFKTESVLKFRSENYSSAPGLVIVYRYFDGEGFVRGPFYNNLPLNLPLYFPPYYCVYNYVYTLPLIKSGMYPMNLYGGDILVDPSVEIYFNRSEFRIIYYYSQYPRIYMSHGNDTITILKDYEVKKTEYSKVYLLKSGYGEEVPLEYGRCNDEKGCISRTYLPLYVLEKDLPKIDLSSRIDDRTVVVVLRESECGVGECYDDILDLGDGRLLIKNVKRDLIVKYSLEKAYKVDLELDGGEVSVSKGFIYQFRNNSYALRGSEIIIKPRSLVKSVGEGIRLVLSSWSEGEWNGTHLILRVDRPLKISPIWRRQYLVSVESPVGMFKNVGWVDEGSRIIVEPLEKVIDLGNGTRAVFKKFEGYGERVEVEVNSPIKLEAEWVREYRVRVESRYVFNYEEWVEEGNGYFITVKKEYDFKNGTVIMLKSMKAYTPSGELEVEDREKTKLLFIEKMDKPIDVEIDWDTYYLINLKSVAPVNGSGGLFREGDLWEAYAEESIQYGNGTVRKFQYWIIDGGTVSEKHVVLTVEKPLNVTCVWKTLHYISILLDAKEGYAIKPDKIVLEGRGEVLELSEPSGFVEEGLWSIRAWYKGIEATKPNTVLIVAGPGPIIVDSILKTVKVTVSDFLGLPVPYATVSTNYTVSKTDYRGEAILVAIPSVDVEAEAESLSMKSSTTIRPADLECRIVLPISPYTILVIASLSLIAGMVYLKYRRR
ncbi:MAG: hypothetical protein QXP91_12670, partial [Candidatus Methanomethylicia archaeon]